MKDRITLNNVGLHADTTSQNSDDSVQKQSGQFRMHITGRKRSVPVDYQPTLLSPLLQEADLIPLLSLKQDQTTSTSDASARRQELAGRLSSMNALELSSLQDEIQGELTNLLTKGESKDESFTEQERKEITGTFHLLQLTRKEYRKALGTESAKWMESRPPGPRSNYSNAADYLFALEENKANLAGASNLAPKDRRATLLQQWRTQARNAAVDRLDGINTRKFPDQARRAQLESAHGLNSNKIPKIDAGRIFGPCTWNELGVGGIIDRFCSKIPPATPQNPSPSRIYEKGVDPNEPMLLRNTVRLKDDDDIARLIAELEQSHSPFHVISLPGTTDGTYERSYVFKFAPDRNNHNTPTWFMLPEVGKEVAGTRVPLGQAKNIDPPAPVMLDFVENPDASRGRSFATEEIASLSKVSADSPPMEVGVKNSKTLPIPDTLQSFLTNLKRNDASFSVMSPRTLAVKNHVAGVKHLGYDVDYLEMDDKRLDMAHSMKSIGCDVKTERLDEGELQELERGLYDHSDSALILGFRTTGNTDFFVAWNEDNRGKGRNLSNGREYDGPPSKLWEKEVVAKKIPVESVTQAYVLPSDAANVTSILADMDKKDAQVALYRIARENGVVNQMNDFDILSQLFIRQYGKGESASYDVGSISDPQNSDLGRALDSFTGNFMLEFHSDIPDLNGDAEISRYCFKAPGLQTQEIPTAISVSLTDTDQEMRPSELLDKVRQMDDPDYCQVHILSTEPISSSAVAIQGMSNEMDPEIRDAVNQADQMDWDTLRDLGLGSIRVDDDDADTVVDFGAQYSAANPGSDTASKRKPEDAGLDGDNGEGSSSGNKKRSGN